MRLYDCYNLAEGKHYWRAPCTSFACQQQLKTISTTVTIDCRHNMQTVPLKLPCRDGCCYKSVQAAPSILTTTAHAAQQQLHTGQLQAQAHFTMANCLNLSVQPTLYRQRHTTQQCPSTHCRAVPTTTQTLYDQPLTIPPPPSKQISAETSAANVQFQPPPCYVHTCSRRKKQQHAPPKCTVYPPQGPLYKPLRYHTPQIPQCLSWRITQPPEQTA